MKKILVTVCLLAACKTASVYKTFPPEIPLHDATGTVVIIDATEGYTPGFVNTKKREEVVTRIKHDFMMHLPGALHKDLGNSFVIDTSLSDSQKILLMNDKSPSLKQKILGGYNATTIIILIDYNGGFIRDGSSIAAEQSGTTAETFFYSVFFRTRFYIIQEQQSWDKEITAKHEFTNKTSLNGMTVTPPDHTVNRKAIEEMAKLNINKTTALFKEQKLVAGR